MVDFIVDLIIDHSFDDIFDNTNDKFVLGHIVMDSNVSPL